MPVDLLSLSAYARHRGCDEAAVRKAVKANRISLIDGKIDPDVADIQWAKNTRPRAASPARAARLTTSIETKGATAPALGKGGASADGAESYQDATARLQRINADRAALEFELKRDDAIGKASALAGAYAGFRALRDRVMAAPRRCARDVLNVGDVREIELRMEAELRRALNLADADYDLLPPELVAALNGRL